jgi:EpsI family protein
VAQPNRPAFLNNTAVRVVTLALLLHAIVLYALARQEMPLNLQPLSTFPVAMHSWAIVQEGYVDEETREVLKADDLLTRMYARAGDPVPINLFIAMFKTQRTGKSPHSPKNCLPGSGWIQSSSGTLSVDIPGREPIVVNRYVVSKGDARSVVLYWYQSHNRIVASEYSAKVYTVVDSMRYNRTDTALVRIVAPVVGTDDDGATKLASGFVKDFFPAIQAALPNCSARMMRGTDVRSPHKANTSGGYLPHLPYRLPAKTWSPTDPA